LRFAAGVIDVMILLPLNLFAVAVNSLFKFEASTLVSAMSSAIVVAYYAISEGVWGASIGKRLLGLRVVITPGRQPPGVIRAIGRTVIFQIPAFVSMTITLVLGEAQLLQFLLGSPLWSTALNAPFVGLLALLFSTARRRNGFAAVHDLWTGTRVVHRDVTEVRRPVLESTPELTINPTGSRRRLGPFDVIGALGRTDIGTLLVGFDPRLRRRAVRTDIVRFLARVVGTPRAFPSCLRS
jgi:uncharacterized RDD family membrane protein YckC